MRIARVVGNLTCTIKDPAHESRKMMLVRFLDDKGEEIILTRGKTYIAQMPVEALCTYTEELTMPD